MQRAFINVVNESSSDDTRSHAWNRMFVTEKTVKSFITMQFALFNTVPGHVAHLRSLGFDMFDDFIDHSYDTEPNYTYRIDAVSIELSRLCSISISDIRQFAIENKHRFKHNADHCITQFNESKKKLTEVLAKLL